VLAKEARLTDGEYDEIKRHPDIGAHIVADVPYLADLVPMIAHHHTWYDGRGYGGASSDEIPLEARILAVADSYDAMTSARPYRGAMSHEDAVQELRRNSGTQFDPATVAAFEAGYSKASDAAAAALVEMVALHEA
jgi:HD-GYP domain-containing protein (c-di-GMP phosphodiesterase class II)